jgi:hypothetical protein
VIIFTELCFVCFSSTRCLNHHSSQASIVQGYVLSFILGTWGYVRWDEMEWTVLIFYCRWIKWLNWIKLFAFVFVAAAGVQSCVCVPAAWAVVWRAVRVPARSLPAQGILSIRTPAYAWTPLRCWPAAKSTNQCTVAHLSWLLCCVVYCKNQGSATKIANQCQVAHLSRLLCCVV